MCATDAPGPATLVVIPTYDEREALPGTLARLRAAVPHAHALVVDDSSPDGTGRWAQQEASRDDHVHVLHRAGKQGLGPAYLAGFAWGLERGYRLLGEMDADASHRPEQLPGLMEAVRRGADLAIGSRWRPGAGCMTAAAAVRSRAPPTPTCGLMGFACGTRPPLRAFRAGCCGPAGRRHRLPGYCFQVDMTRPAGPGP